MTLLPIVFKMKPWKSSCAVPHYEQILELQTFFAQYHSYNEVKKVKGRYLFIQSYQTLAKARDYALHKVTLSIAWEQTILLIDMSMELSGYWVIILE